MHGSRNEPGPGRGVFKGHRSGPGRRVHVDLLRYRPHRCDSPIPSYFSYREFLLPRQTSTRQPWTIFLIVELLNAAIRPMAYLRLVLITSTLGLGLVGSSVRASCGDYVTWKNGSNKKAFADKSSSPHASMSFPAEHSPGHPEFPSKRCTGLWCSEGNRVPLLPVLPRSVETDHWVLGMIWPAPVNSDPDSLVISHFPYQPIHQSAQIFHPPR